MLVLRSPLGPVICGRNWGLAAIQDNPNLASLKSLLLKFQMCQNKQIGLTPVIIKFYSRKHNKNNNNIMQVHHIVIHVYKFVRLLNYFYHHYFSTGLLFVWVKVHFRGFFCSNFQRFSICDCIAICMSIKYLKRYDFINCGSIYTEGERQVSVSTNVIKQQSVNTNSVAGWGTLIFKGNLSNSTVWVFSLCLFETNYYHVWLAAVR